LPRESEVSAVLEASVLCSSGEVMADDHFMPGRSVDVRYADVFDILLVEAIKNCCVSSSERGNGFKLQDAPFAGDDNDRDVLARFEL
jgi:hypothetical protein